MIFTETELTGAFIVDLEPRTDTRGFFARAFCQREFASHGLDASVAQMNISLNHRKGTVRGLHFQYPPGAEAKFVRCSRGAILDVVVDLRPESPTYLRHVMVELTADNRRGIVVPERCAHGFQVLEDATETTYLVSEFYAPGLEDGLRHDDPALAIAWPLPASDMSDKDRAWPLLAHVESAVRARMTLQAHALQAPVGAR
ncbi:MAG: dTDP-4-dehydrorhamnose 3,5-epimerase family protein [Acidobacteria bacterium]|nr:dTDP-4-dehydrorhamnose 3,5-epimerase family protein [Acidobacteriota bacterium]